MIFTIRKKQLPYYHVILSALTISEKDRDVE